MFNVVEFVVTERWLHGRTYWQVLCPNGYKHGLYNYKRNAQRAMKRLAAGKGHKDTLSKCYNKNTFTSLLRNN